MSADRSDHPEPARGAGISDIAEQSVGRYAIADGTVHSCNRLGRIGNLPSVNLRDWWPWSASRRG